jgi:hypothetical protein
MTSEIEIYEDSPDQVVVVLHVLAGARAMLGSRSTAGIVAFGHFASRDEALASILCRGLGFDEERPS